MLTVTDVQSGEEIRRRAQYGSHSWPPIARLLSSTFARDFGGRVKLLGVKVQARRPRLNHVGPALRLRGRSEPRSNTQRPSSDAFGRPGAPDASFLARCTLFIAIGDARADQVCSKRVSGRPRNSQQRGGTFKPVSRRRRLWRITREYTYGGRSLAGTFARPSNDTAGRIN